VDCRADVKAPEKVMPCLTPCARGEIKRRYFSTLVQINQSISRRRANTEGKDAQMTIKNFSKWLPKLFFVHGKAETLHR